MKTQRSKAAIKHLGAIGLRNFYVNALINRWSKHGWKEMGMIECCEYETANKGESVWFLSDLFYPPQN